MSVLFWETKIFAEKLRAGSDFAKYVNSQHGRPLRFYEQLCKEPVVRLPPGYTDQQLQGWCATINKSINDYNAAQAEATGSDS